MLKAKDIHKKYKQPVLRGVCLDAYPGEIIGIAGENGSGKSTLLSIITGITPPNAGNVYYNNENIYKKPKLLKQLVGYVPQENSLFENLTAIDNLKLWASAYGSNWKNALPNLSADDSFLKKKVSKLSGGMKKRLSIAISLTHEPGCLILDEPSAGLDIGFRRSLMDTMVRLKNQGKCVVFTSHSPDELLLCDRIYVLKDGVFVYCGPPRELQSEPGAESGFTAALWQIMGS